jgi:hypothetical protein
MKKKVKKFGRGGDIVTGIGAALVGKALYDKYLGKGGDKDDDYDSRVKEYNRRKDAEKTLVETKNNKSENKAADEKPVDNTKYVEQHRAITAPNPVEPPANNLPKPKLKNKNKNKDKDKDKDKDSSQSDNQSNSTHRGLGLAGSDATDKSKPYPVNTVVNEQRQTKAYPTETQRREKKAAVAKAEDDKLDKGYEYPGARRAVRRLFPYSDMGDPRGTPTMRARNADPNRAYLKEMADKGKAREDERKRLEAAEAERKRRNRPSSVEMMTQSLGGGFKRGGSVKASKMGSVKTAKPAMRSASSRADGIAIRGKTRA